LNNFADFLFYDNKNFTQMAKIVLQTSRFLFSEQVTELLTEFSKIHQYDERKDYKEAWTEWIQDPDIKPELDAEIERIQNLGFEGDVLDKMFKSVRYYYRKKHSKNLDDEKDTEGRSPRTYDTLPNTVLAKIDEHIKAQIKTNIIIDNSIIKSSIKPAICFDNFCNENKPLVVELLNNTFITNDAVKQLIAKLKKSYKNRYYNIKVSIEKSQ
jgi:hypothetical protein